MEVNYNSISKQENRDSLTLATLQEGDVIDLDSIRIKPHLTFAIEGNILIDM